MSSASLHFLSFTPKTLSSSSLFASSSVKLPSKLTVSVSSSSSSVNNHALQHHHQQQQRCSRFVRNVAISSEVEEEGDLDFSGPEAVEEQSFSADLKLFVGNLPFDVDSAALAGLFEQAGNVEMVEVIYDKITGRSRGFGFVTMSSLQEVEAAAQQFNGYEIQGRALRVNYGPPPPKKEYSSPRGSGGGGSYGSSNRVYVGNLAWGVDNDALEGLFSEQGKVIEARVVYDRETGRSRGFGFVTYGSSEEVNSAVQSLDGADLGGRTIRVSPAEDRPKRY